MYRVCLIILWRSHFFVCVSEPLDGDYPVHTLPKKNNRHSVDVATLMDRSGGVLVCMCACMYMCTHRHTNTLYCMYLLYLHYIPVLHCTGMYCKYVNVDIRTCVMCYTCMRMYIRIYVYTYICVW